MSCLSVRIGSPYLKRSGGTEIHVKAQSVASSIVEELQSTTDLSLFDCKSVAYFTLATHALAQFDAFPVLVLEGETNTGKNAIIYTILRCAFHVRDPLILRGTTYPVLRDYLIETRGGTAVIDEGDSMAGHGDFEELLKCRSRKEQGRLTINRKLADGKTYKRESYNIYGALVVHRQAPFASPSLVTRCITIHTHSNLDRLYGKSNKKRQKVELDFKSLEPFELDGAPRVAENWEPLASVANYLSDNEFLIELSNQMVAKSVELIEEAQAAEPARIVLDGALALSLTLDGQWRAATKGRWKIAELSEWIMKEHGITINPWQVGRILKGHGLKTVKSHGSYRVDFEPQDLLQAMNGSHDESLEMLVSLVNRSTRSTKSTPKAKLWDDENF